jgi:hypothetical protein
VETAPCGERDSGIYKAVTFGGKDAVHATTAKDSPKMAVRCRIGARSIELICEQGVAGAGCL